MLVKNLFLKRIPLVFKVIFLVLPMLIAINLGVLAQEALSFEPPVLVTSAGQCIDYKTTSMLVKRLKLEYTENANIKPEELKEDIKTVIMVVGHSLKGLGSAGISEEEELTRVKQVLEVAKEMNIPIVLFHLGGEMRRGPTSKPFIDAVLAYSKYVVVYAQGNNDKYFTNYCNEKNIPMTEISKVVEAKDVLKKMFNLE